LILLVLVTYVLQTMSVSLWVTTGDRSKLLQKQPDITWRSGNGPNANKVVINGNQKFQTTVGFGGAMTDGSAYLISKLSPSVRNELMQDFFGSDGVRSSFLRLSMGSSDFATQRYSFDDLPAGKTDPQLQSFSIRHDQAYIIPIILQAQSLNPQLTILSSQWSPPAWMKNNGNMDGGSLLPQFWNSYTNYEIMYLQQYAKLGVKIDYITIQNEPMANQGFPSMVMQAPDQRDLIKKNFGPAFKANNISTKILVLDHNWDLTQYVQTVLGDPTAKSYVSGVAWHCYGGNPSAQTTIHNAYPDMDTFFTECSPFVGKDFGSSLVDAMDQLYAQTVNNWARGVLQWNIALDTNNGPHVNGGCDSCRGFYTILPNGTYVKEGEYYSLAHSSKFVDVGAHRIGSSSGGSISVVAYQNPDGTIVAIVANKSKNTQQFDLNWANQFVSYTLPGQSAATFTWSSSNNVVMVE